MTERKINSPQHGGSLFLYVDREGRIIFEYDNFDEAEENSETPAAAIDESNSFQFSLPVSSTMLVNEVNAEAYILEPTDKPLEEIDVNEGGFTKDGSTYRCTIELKNVFKTIDKNRCKVFIDTIEITSITISNVLFNELDIEFTYSENVLTKFKVGVYTMGESTLKPNKIEIRKTAEKSISANGVYGYDFKPGQLLVSEELQKLKDMAEKICQPVLKKYADTRNYVKATWKGNLQLTAGTNFEGKSVHENTSKTYNCLSVETVLGENLRQSVKGRAIKL